APDLHVAVAAAELALDQLADPRQRPAVAGETLRHRALLQQLRQLLPLRRTEAGRAAEPRRVLQRIQPAHADLVGPAPHRFAADVQAVGHFGLAHAAQQQLPGLDAALLQLVTNHWVRHPDLLETPAPG